MRPLILVEILKFLNTDNKETTNNLNDQLFFEPQSFSGKSMQVISVIASISKLHLRSFWLYDCFFPMVKSKWKWRFESNVWIEEIFGTMCGLKRCFQQSSLVFLTFSWFIFLIAKIYFLEVFERCEEWGDVRKNHVSSTASMLCSNLFFITTMVKCFYSLVNE